MKTSTTLTILGAYQTLIGLVAMFFATSMAEMALVESYVSDANLLHLTTNMHVGIGHAFFMIGILLLASQRQTLQWPKPFSSPTSCCSPPQRLPPGIVVHRLTNQVLGALRNLFPRPLLLPDFLCRDGFQYLHNQHLFAQA